MNIWEKEKQRRHHYSAKCLWVRFGRFIWRQLVHNLSWKYTLLINNVICWNVKSSFHSNIIIFTWYLLTFFLVMMSLSAFEIDRNANKCWHVCVFMGFCRALKYLVSAILHPDWLHVCGLFDRILVWYFCSPYPKI